MTRRSYNLGYPAFRNPSMVMRTVDMGEGGLVP
jgi:hypothetical protein